MNELRANETIGIDRTANSHRPVTVACLDNGAGTASKAGKTTGIEPTGLKAKIGQLEKLVALQADEINAQRIEFDALKDAKDKTEQFYQDHLKEIRQSVISDMQQLQEDIGRMVSNQKAENARLLSQINALRMEKSATQHQLIALQRRVFAIDDEIGVD